MSDKVYIGVDQSLSKTAYCILSEDYDLLDFGVIKTDSKSTLFKRCLTISSELFTQVTSFLLKNHPKSTYIFIREGLSFGSISNSTRDLAYLVGYLESHFKIPFKEISPKLLKRLATGNGSADKQEMFNSLPEPVRESFIDAGYKKTTGLYDLTDAYFIAMQYENSVIENTIKEICNGDEKQWLKDNDYAPAKNLDGRKEQIRQHLELENKE